MKQVEFDVRVSEIRLALKEAFNEKMDRQAAARERFKDGWDRLRRKRDEVIEHAEREYREMQLEAEREINELRKGVEHGEKSEEGEA